MFAIKTNIPAVLKKLDELKTMLDGGWQRGCIKVLEQAREKVAAATPRSAGWEARMSVLAPIYKRTHSTARKRSRRKINRAFQRAVGARRPGHLADAWRLKLVGGTPKSRTPVLGVIYNTDTTGPTGAVRPSARLRAADGSVRDYTLLHTLEYGTRPHTILPVTAKVLAFTADGEQVFTRVVRHPGTKAYGMIRTTRVWMTEALLRHTEQWRTSVLARYWASVEASRMEPPR